MKAYGSRRDTVFSFMTNDSNAVTDKTNKGKDKVKVLLVQLLPRGSIMVFYRHSHLYKLGTKDSKIGLLEVSKESLQRDGIEPVEVTMKDGGL